MIIIYKYIYITILLLKFRSNKWNSDKWSSTIFVTLLLFYFYFKNKLLFYLDHFDILYILFIE